MNVLFLTLEGLRYDKVKAFGGDKLRSFVIDSLAAQGTCFHNFRLTSSINKKNIKFLKKEIPNLFDEEIHYCDSLYIDEIKEHLSEVDNKEQFLMWKHIPLDLGKYITRPRSLRVSHYVLKQTIEWLDESGYLENTTIVLMGTSGFHDKDEHPFAVFKNKDESLYDENIHVPLIVFHPEWEAKDVANAVNMDDVPGLVTGLIYDRESENSILKLCKGDEAPRADLMSQSRNTYGLRGPMFQYFCRLGKDKKVVAQELYDLNNDYKMQRNLLVKMDDVDTLGTQVYDLINVYRERVLGNV